MGDSPMTSAAVKASIIIVNWNGREHLAACLDSLAAQSWRDFQVILVDNGSTDGSVPFVRERYPWVELVPLAGNTGFATGNNLGLAQARGEFIIALNNDTRVEPDWLETLVTVAEAHPRAGLIGSRICAFDDADRIDSLGVGICRDGMSRGWSRHQRWSELQLPAVVPILFPSGCAALYRRQMLEEIGFFDDDFFAYCEDTDLGLRGRVAGWDALLATQAVVYHKYSSTAGVLSPFKLYLVERNHYWVVLKSFPWPYLLLLPVFTLCRFAEQLRVVFAGQGAGGEFRAAGSRRALVGALLRGMADALAGTPRMLKRRRLIMRGRVLSPSAMGRLLAQYRLSFRELLGAEAPAPPAGEKEVSAC
ncbi:MAG: glycosyltransferase family 2 protein [Desulfuromonadales bacterium]|nr:glycosyltransferase family 2 protein [Desulfuromonadales bacterium]